MIYELYVSEGWQVYDATLIYSTADNTLNVFDIVLTQNCEDCPMLTFKISSEDVNASLAVVGNSVAIKKNGSRIFFGHIMRTIRNAQAVISVECVSRDFLHTKLWGGYNTGDQPKTLNYVLSQAFALDMYPRNYYGIDSTKLVKTAGERFEKTEKEFISELLSGGYFRTVYTGDGTLDYVTDFYSSDISYWPEYSKSRIDFGINLIDFEYSADVTNHYNAARAQAKVKSEGGADEWIFGDYTAQNPDISFGKTIWKLLDFTGSIAGWDQADELSERAQHIVDLACLPIINISVKAVDLSLLDPSYEELDIFHTIRVSIPDVVDNELMAITESELHLDNPAENSYVITNALSVKQLTQQLNGK